MRLIFEVAVEVAHRQGKFASRDEQAEIDDLGHGTYTDERDGVVRDVETDQVIV